MFFDLGAKGGGISKVYYVLSRFLITSCLTGPSPPLHSLYEHEVTVRLFTRFVLIEGDNLAIEQSTQNTFLSSFVYAMGDGGISILEVFKNRLDVALSVMV
ncbi:hypothetical protein DUI87_18250 [Hirundo rustica rustica]|uniref:Uncharacterized protein n=1 Tax=Hirundo rustica rustica TaxID=333673 RepID=A0A3M0JW46_HIRRU|nr:hypothetical protein DUI87_18250 [Hirundo rustica rustica]